MRFLLYNFDPAFRSLNAAHLDAGECFVKFLGNRSHFLHSAGEADLFAVVVDLSNRRDNGCGTAETALCEIFDFVEAYFSFLNLKSEIIFRYSDKRTTGNGRKNAVRLRSNDFASLVTKMKFAPPVSSTLVLVAASRYMFSSKPWRCASMMG